MKIVMMVVAVMAALCGMAAAQDVPLGDVPAALVVAKGNAKQSMPSILGKTAAASHEVPDCFTPNDVQKAAYTLTVNLGIASKDDLVSIMNLANDGEIHKTPPYPMISPDGKTMTIVLLPSDTILENLGDAYYAMIRDCVENKMRGIATYEAVSLSCIKKTKK